MTEPDVTLTDLGLAALCFVFAVFLLRRAGIAIDFALLFAALGLASLLGGVYHGWFSGQTSPFADNLWLATMFAIGLANLMLWVVSGDILAGGRYAVVFRWIAGLQFAAFAYAAIFVTRDFLLPSAASVPPTLLLLLAFTLALASSGAGGLALGVAGIVTAIAAAVLQQMGVGLPALRLSHNGLYHIIQALAFTLLFLSVPAVDRYLAMPR